MPAGDVWGNSWADSWASSWADAVEYVDTNPVADNTPPYAIGGGGGGTSIEPRIPRRRGAVSGAWIDAERRRDAAARAKERIERARAAASRRDASIVRDEIRALQNETRASVQASAQIAQQLADAERAIKALVLAERERELAIQADAEEMMRIEEGQIQVAGLLDELTLLEQAYDDAILAQDEEDVIAAILLM